MRLLLVVSSLAPVFVLLAIRGQSPIPEKYHLLIMLTLAVAPSFVLIIRIRTAARHMEARNIKIGTSNSQRSNIVSYLLAVLLPFVGVSSAEWRNFAASIATVAFIILVLWLMKFHYLNILFELLNRRTFEIVPPDTDNSFADTSPRVVITWRKSLSGIKSVYALKLTDSVYWERRE